MVRPSHSLALATFIAVSCPLALLAQQSAQNAAIAGVKIIFADPPQPVPTASVTLPPQTAMYPPEMNTPSTSSSFEKLVRGRIKSVTVTWSDPELFTTRAQAEDLLRQLLTSTRTETYGYHIWSFGDSTPSLTATIEDSHGRPGRWIVWCPPPGLYWAFQDGEGKWSWGSWNSTPLPKSAETDTSGEEKLIALFASSHNPADLHKALDAVALISLGEPCRGNNQPCPQKKIQANPRVAALWLELFAAIDATQSELAKHLKTVYTQVSPPGAAGLQYGDGVAPSQVKDPVLRAQYEHAIAKNEKNLATSNQFAEVRTLKEHADSDFWVWASDRYRGDLGARDEMAQEAATVGCSLPRIDWLKAIVGASSMKFPPPDPFPAS